MAWPDDQELPVEVWAAFGADLTDSPDMWSWTDLSDRLRAEPIRLRAGKSGGASRVSPGTCTVTLVNDDAALTPLHPMSPYWPDVELGTPLRVSLRHVEDAFGRTSTTSWGATDGGLVWSGYGAGGSILSTDFPMSGGTARHSVPVAAAFRTSWLPAVSLRDCRVHLSGVSLPFSDVTGGSVEPGNILLRAQSTSVYYLARVEITTGEAVLCRLYNPSGGLLASATVPGLTHSASQTLEVVAEVSGFTLAMKVWATGSAEPAGWAVTATDDSLTLPGGVGIRTGVAGGNSNAKPVVASYESVTVWVDRFSGFADQWEPTYVPTGEVNASGIAEMASAVRVTCSGILRRLQQGRQLALSPLRRTITASSPAVYYPAEDGVVATAAGSAMSGEQPLTVSGTVEFKPVDDYQYNTRTIRYGTSALADLAGGGSMSVTLSGAVSAATTSAWTVHAIAKADVTLTSGDVVLLGWSTPGGTHSRWELRLVKATGRTQVIAYTGAGTATVVIDRPAVLTSFTTWAVTGWQVAPGSIEVTYWLAASAPMTNSVAGTLGGVAAMTVNPTGATSSIPMPVGHLAVWSDTTIPYRTEPMFDSYGGVVFEALRSFRDEAAHDRLARLAAEDGVALDMPDVDEDAVQRMGWQAAGTALDLYRECEDVDGGVLSERGFGLAYLPRSHRYNPPVDLTIDLATYAVTGRAEVLSPVFDDQDIRNEWTVERRDGSFVVASDPVSQRRGVYSDAIELNLASDGQLPDQASWRVHLDSGVDLREATFPIDLAANPGLVDGWLSCGVGSRIVRTNPPAQHRPGDLDRLVEGWTETIGPRSWLAQVAPSPAEPWDVAVADGDQLAGADGSTLAASLTDTGMTLSLASTAQNGVWTTAAAQFPMDLRVGGERVTASAISGGSSPQTVTLSARGVNGVQRAWPAGTEVDVWEPAIAPL